MRCRSLMARELLLELVGVDIELLDHVIITSEDFVSLALEHKL